MRSIRRKSIERFWLVWCPQGKAPPAHRHGSFESAQAEAARLARQCLGQEFFVLEAQGCARKIDVEWVDTETRSDEIPF